MSEQLFCLIRHMWVAALPEEKVRQRLLYTLIHQLGYPKGNISIEKHVNSFSATLPISKSINRRADIVCFHQALPLLLIECKSTALTPKAIRQVIGYNLLVKAPFIAIANQTQLHFGWYDSIIQDFQFITSIPPYQNLIRLNSK